MGRLGTQWRQKMGDQLPLPGLVAEQMQGLANGHVHTAVSRLGRV